jgi:hypothetical protein
MVIEQLQELFERHPEAKSLWGAVKKLAKIKVT